MAGKILPDIQREMNTNPAAASANMQSYSQYYPSTIQPLMQANYPPNEIMTQIPPQMQFDLPPGFLSTLIQDPCWIEALIEEFQKEYFRSWAADISYHEGNILCIKVVILGQDPYHKPGKAMGLAFSVPFGIKIPRSLQNILTELHNDIGIKIPNHGCLTYWAQRGVFLLNSILTVQCFGVVFLLWGNIAHTKETLIDTKKHKVIKTSHPSPMSVKGFFNTHCFSTANIFLGIFGKTPIDWQLQ
ncbi:hypothetical protein KUTeg_008143, partial [Tegillarca granosa]